MVTRLYFHSANSLVSGTLPSSEQSTLTAAVSADFQTVNRSMDTTIGTSQTSLNIPATASTRDLYYTKFVSLPIFQTSIAANTWTYAFGAFASSTSINFPVSGANQPVYVNCYVWRPSTGAKIGTILDGNTASTVDEPGSPVATYHIVSFSGLQVTGVQGGDVIIFEVWFRITSAASGANQLFYYDGTTVYTENNTSTSSIASYIETPETLNFTSGTLFTRNIATETVTISDSVARAFTGFGHYQRSPATETVTISDSIAIATDTTNKFTAGRTYWQPVRPRIKIYALTDSSYSNALYTYDAFLDTGNTAKPISLSFESTTGNAGVFTLEIEDSTNTLDLDTFSRGNRVVIECSKNGSLYRIAFKGVIRSIDQRVYGQTGKNIILKGYSYLIRLTERVVDFQAQSALDGSGNYIRTDSSMFTNTLLNTILTDDSTYLYTQDDSALYNFFRVNNIGSSSINQWIPRIDAQLATLDNAVASILEFSSSLLGINMSNDQLVLYNQDNVTTDSQIFLVTNKVDKDSDSADTTMYPIEPYSYNFGYDNPDNASRLIASIGQNMCAETSVTTGPDLNTWDDAAYVALWSATSGNLGVGGIIGSANSSPITFLGISCATIGAPTGANINKLSCQWMAIFINNTPTFQHVDFGSPFDVHVDGEIGKALPTAASGVSTAHYAFKTPPGYSQTLLGFPALVSGFTTELGLRMSVYTTASQNASNHIRVGKVFPYGKMWWSWNAMGGSTGGDNQIIHYDGSDVYAANQPTFRTETEDQITTTTPACGGPPNIADSEPNFLVAADMNQINRIGMIEKVITSLPDHIKNSQTMNEYFFAKIYSSSKPKFTFDFPSVTMPNTMPVAGDIVCHVDTLAKIGISGNPIQTGIISQINYDFKQDDEGVLGLTKLALQTSGIKRGSY